MIGNLINKISHFGLDIWIMHRFGDDFSWRYKLTMSAKVKTRWTYQV